MSLELAPFRFHGWVGNRKTESFGWRYDFDDSRFTPAEPIPHWLGPLRPRRPPRGTCARDFIHVLLARYDPGAGIGWHRDRDVFEQVVGVSLNTPAILRFRQTDGTGSAAPRSRQCRGRLTCSPAKAGGTGSIAFHPAPSCASRSRSARFPSAAEGGSDPKSAGGLDRLGRLPRYTASAFRLQGTRRPSAPLSKR